MPTAPQWAQDLVLRVALAEGRDDVPELTWHRAGKRKRYYRDAAEWLRIGRAAPVKLRLLPPSTRSSGRAWPLDNRIHVTAGTGRTDQKLVLLHELAHWLCEPKEHHSPRFWDKAFELYRRYRVPIRYATKREGKYRKGALVAARRK